MTKMVLDRVNVLLASGKLPTPDDLSHPAFIVSWDMETRIKAQNDAEAAEAAKAEEKCEEMLQQIATVKKRVDGERGESVRRCFSRKRQ
jgi:hypothetical protein